MPDANTFTPALRPATADDIAAILALDRTIPTAPHWSASEYRACLISETTVRRLLLVAERSEAIVGYIAGKALAFNEGEGACDVLAEIESIAVSPLLRRQGTGRLLCCAMLDWFSEQMATAVDLEVRISSVAAIGLYRSLGFQQVGLRRAYYRDPFEDALAMRLDRRYDHTARGRASL